MKYLRAAKKLELEIWNHLPYMIRRFGITGGTTTIQSPPTCNTNNNHKNILPIYEWFYHKGIYMILQPRIPSGISDIFIHTMLHGTNHKYGCRNLPNKNYYSNYIPISSVYWKEQDKKTQIIDQKWKYQKTS